MKNYSSKIKLKILSVACLMITRTWFPTLRCCPFPLHLSQSQDLHSMLQSHYHWAQWHYQWVLHQCSLTTVLLHLLLVPHSGCHYWREILEALVLETRLAVVFRCLTTNHSRRVSPLSVVLPSSPRSRVTLHIWFVVFSSRGFYDMVATKHSQASWH